MPLMGSLHIGKSGLQTSQNALNTTSHNISNLDTKGYTRQQVSLGTKDYTKLAANATGSDVRQYGLGVDYVETRQVRDYFLDKTYRKESGRNAFFANSYTALTEVETILGELYGATFNDSLGDLKEALDELAKTPTDSVVQGLVVQRADAFLDSAKAVYNGLSDYQDNLNLQIKTKVEQLNEYAHKLHDLNVAILKVESGNVEHANDLKDARNQILDEMGELAAINYTEDIYGNVIVQVEGHDFVSKDLVYDIELYQDDVTGFYTPYWQMDATYTTDSFGIKHYNIAGAEVFDTTRTISSELNTDIGGIKALIYARGDHRADYTDLADADYYNTNISQSIIMNVQAEFDQLIHGIATEINRTLAEAADTTTGYLCYAVEKNDVTTYQPIQLFEKVVTDGYRYNDDTRKWEFVPEEADKKETLYSVNNLNVNADLKKSPTKLSYRKPDGSDDFELASKLAKLFQGGENDESTLTLNPNVATRANFMGYYNDLVSQIANSGQVFKSFCDSQQKTVDATAYAREEIVGASSDEELSNMIRYQNAYNASSRYINVIDEMIEHIINTFAR
ncbi:MAG: flagellar hook-associated protein FlgK [Lachnospiraceae bacterium]|nr:flagellar hook-associated protein FlgK [Lachnospiraceae bacterium]